MVDSSHKPEGTRFSELVELISRLRAPGGCPWDREQTHESLKPMMLEEAYEVVEAIDEGNDEEFVGELGDLLLQVVFHSQIATEQDRFTVADVIERVSSKMIRRHPHVFGEDKAETSGEVLRNWEALKEAELREKGKLDGGQTSMLDSVSTKLPAVMEAFQMTTKVSRVDFDWPDVASVLEKLDEEVDELKSAVAKPIAQSSGDRGRSRRPAFRRGQRGAASGRGPRKRAQSFEQKIPKAIPLHRRAPARAGAQAFGFRSQRDGRSVGRSQTEGERPGAFDIRPGQV